MGYHKVHTFGTWTDFFKAPCWLKIQPKHVATIYILLFSTTQCSLKAYCAI